MAMMFESGGCEGMLLSLESHKAVPAPFLTKTYQLVDDPSTDHIVSWGEDDTTFVVWRPPEFARDLLPNYFKHNNFASFVRQLNTYGFRKIVPDRWEFANEFFKKGEKHLLCEIHRRKTLQPQIIPQHLPHHHHPTAIQPGFFPIGPRSSVSPPSCPDEHHLMAWYDSSPTSPLSEAAAAAASSSCTSISALAEDNERLRRSNSMLLSELAHMRKLYNDILYFVQNHVKPVSPSSSFPSSLFLSGPSMAATNPSCAAAAMDVDHQPSFHSHLPAAHHVKASFNSYCTSGSSISVLEEPDDGGCNHVAPSCRTKLFGVPLHSKKRLHPDPSSSHENHPMTRLGLGKEDLGLNLMPPSPC